VDLSIKNLSPFSGKNIKIVTGCQGERLESISPAKDFKENNSEIVIRPESIITIESIKPKSELVFKLKYRAQAYDNALLCYSHPSDSDLSKTANPSLRGTINAKQATIVYSPK
jgi:hypothetical protein